MKINGIELFAMFGKEVKFLEYTVANPSYTRAITFSGDDYKILNKKATVGVNHLQVRFAIYADKDTAYKYASNIVAATADAIVNFGGDLNYKVTPATDGSFQLLANDLFEYTLQLQVLDKFGGGVEIVTTSASPITITNPGNIKTGIIIEVTPTTSITSFSVYGFGRHTSSNPLVVNNPTMNKKTILDGVDFRVLQETTGGYVEKFASTNLFSFPYILSGDTTLVFSPNNLNIRILYNPRYI